MLTIEIARVTEAAAVAAARFSGRGDERLAEHAAAAAMRQALNLIVDMDGLVVIGEGEREAAPMLYIGEKVGGGGAVRIDIALKPLEGATLCVKALPNSIACVALAEAGSLLHAPDIYMNKIAIGAGYPAGTVDLDLPPQENVRRMATAKGVAPGQITACILDRPRHADLIGVVRDLGCAIRLITDGDVAGVIHAAQPEETGIDIYLGIGGAPEGVLAAAALRCIGGQMQGRLVATNASQRERAHKVGFDDLDRKFTLEDLASGDVMFAATGVTDGDLLKGVHFDSRGASTQSLVMRSRSGTVRLINATHHLDKLAGFSAVDYV